MNREVQHKYALAISGIAIFLSGALAAFLSFHALKPLIFPSSPIVLGELEMISSPVLCPGDKLRFKINLSVIEPSIIQVSENFIDVSTGASIPGLGATFDPRPHPVPVDLHQEIVRDIPNLPAGGYEHVTGFFVVGNHSEVKFLTIPFSIREGCAPLPPTPSSHLSICKKPSYLWYGTN